METRNPLNLKNTVSIQLGDDKYELKYPNVAQVLEINNKKYLITENRYPDLVLAPNKTVMDVFYLDLVDAVSHFTVLAPGMSKKLSVDSLLEIDGVTASTLVKAYKKQFRPWYEPFLKVMLDVDKESKEENKEESTSEEAK